MTGSDNDLSLVWRQVFAWTYADFCQLGYEKRRWSLKKDDPSKMCLC